MQFRFIVVPLELVEGLELPSAQQAAHGRNIRELELVFNQERFLRRCRHGSLYGCNDGSNSGSLRRSVGRKNQIRSYQQ